MSKIYKTQQDVWAALVAGKKVAPVHESARCYWYFKKGRLYWAASAREETLSISLFKDAAEGKYQEYIDPEWYEDIPEGGVYCLVRQFSSSSTERVIIRVNNGNGRFVDNDGFAWDVATPIKSETIETLLANARKVAQ